jgi:hypothetical protein
MDISKSQCKPNEVYIAGYFKGFITIRAPVYSCMSNISTLPLSDTSCCNMIKWETTDTTIKSKLDVNFFIIKLNPDLSTAWCPVAITAKAIMAKPCKMVRLGRINIQDINIDKARNVIVAGSFSGHVKVGDVHLSSKEIKYNSWLGKLDKDGKWIFVTKAEQECMPKDDSCDERRDECNISCDSETSEKSEIMEMPVEQHFCGQYITICSISSDRFGNIIVVGEITGSFSYNGNTVTSQRISIYVAKFDKEGNNIWFKYILVTKQLKYEYWPTVTSTYEGDSFICFYSENEIILKGTNNDNRYQGSGNLDMWVIKINYSGEWGYPHRFDCVCHHRSKPIDMEDIRSSTEISQKSVFVVGSRYANPCRCDAFIAPLYINKN